MSREGYLAISIAVLALLGALAVVLFLALRKGPKPERRHCEGCAEAYCPIAQRNHKEEGQ